MGSASQSGAAADELDLGRRGADARGYRERIEVHCLLSVCPASCSLHMEIGQSRGGKGNGQDSRRPTMQCPEVQESGSQGSRNLVAAGAAIRSARQRQSQTGPRDLSCFWAEVGCCQTLRLPLSIGTALSQARLSPDSQLPRVYRQFVTRCGSCTVQSTTTLGAETNDSATRAAPK